MRKVIAEHRHHQVRQFLVVAFHLADDVQLLAAQSVEIGFVSDEKFFVRQAGDSFNLREQHVVGAVLDVLQERLELGSAVIFQLKPFLGARAIPLPAHPGGHAGAEAQTADEFVLSRFRVSCERIFTTEF